jgi:hypothetical protein
MVIDHLFADDPENGEKFWAKVKSAKKDEVTLPDSDSDSDSVIDMHESEL